jgi:hypothetical protein
MTDDLQVLYTTGQKKKSPEDCINFKYFKFLGWNINTADDIPCSSWKCPVHGQGERNRLCLLWHKDIAGLGRFHSWIIHFNKYCLAPEITKYKDWLNSVFAKCLPGCIVKYFVHYRSGMPHFHIGIWYDGDISQAALENEINSKRRNFYNTVTRLFFEKVLSDEDPVKWLNYGCKGRTTLQDDELPPVGGKYYRWYYGFKPHPRIAKPKKSVQSAKNNVQDNYLPKVGLKNNYEMGILKVSGLTQGDTMTPEIESNARHQVAMAIARAMSKFDKENPEHPSRNEWLVCLDAASRQVATYLGKPKKGPGRPRKAPQEAGVRIIDGEDEKKAV